MDTAPVKKNDEITVLISGVTDEGAGVGRIDGFAVFVPYALPGETVRAHIIKVAKNYAVGKLIELIDASPDRVEPVCPHFYKCGACSLLHMNYTAQLEFKRRIVVDALERIGGFTGVKVEPTVGMDEPFRYRNKGCFPFAETEDGLHWGLYAARSHRLIPLNDCIIESKASVEAANAVLEWAKECGVPAYDEETGKGALRHVVTRSCTGGSSVCIVTTGRLPEKEKLVELLKKAVPDLKCVVHNINANRTNVIFGKVFRTVYGEDKLVHTLMGSSFEVSQESFLQVNTAQTEKLYSLAVEGLELTGKETVADVFCGIGTITLLLAKKAAHAVGIEYVPRAVKDAESNALLNGVSNAEFHTGAAEEVLPRLIAEGRKFDRICLDPPRKGADPAVIKAIADSKAERIAYVSCSPATLARDLKLLCSYGYSIERVAPMDMFPFTQHVETVVLMYRTV